MRNASRSLYPDNIEADRTAMQSLKQNRSLQIEGVEHGVADGIWWQPTDAYPDTGEIATENSTIT